MATLTLTEEERKEKSYLNWSDETLGKVTKAIASNFYDTNASSAKYSSAAIFLVSQAIKSGVDESVIDLINEELGQWRIKVERI